ncbi:hypothetical protein ACFQI7_19025 [Paenibacillus allorhizosphaerae]|uniref:Uncharacterized protein n=1 Tax=Paenibacillus allorhizosphaerae TaxID=2849866 RepID=A0ABM8VSH2_9BACL|nr:hypothetical protein [Paenibacillus allorhizosphaerae]CAG7656547.1 hypothetical protein PAECIP111802_06452 [Paenibacillus allorhizosphaerae]
MKTGYELVEDSDFEEAKKMGYFVRAYQGNITIYPPGKITGFSTDHIAIDEKRVFREANRFQIVDTPKTSKK